ncbi:carboxypeptidase B-like [Anopheles arabiensis]|uniref:Peptidase M14 domain-containing protein n=1 Tax=Anopheles arabiensis TaxID=7173 RepID=A0A8W7MTZ6_ANOAR|nr:carboxypeptidase B-like [Anopheles arabiensis]
MTNMLGVLLAFLTLATVNCRPNFAYNQSVPYTNLQSDLDSFNVLDVFMSYDQTNQWLAALAAEYPDKCKVQPIGDSFYGLDINAIHINTQQSKKIFVVANLNAREWAAMTSAIYIIHELVRNSNRYPDAAKYQWVVVPITNPDGYEYTRTTDRFWRKNRYPQTETEFGTDLNRNFDYMWDLLLNEEDDDRLGETYRGPVPLSEFEARAIAKFLQQNANSIVLYVDLQAYGEYLMIPWGYTKDPAPNADFLTTVAQAGSKAITDPTRVPRDAPFYLVGSAAELMKPAPGSSIDYCLSVGVKACIAMKLTNRSYEIYTWGIPIFGQQALAAVQAMADKADEG